MAHLPRFQAGLIADASTILEQAEAAAKKQLKNSKNLRQTGRFPAATEWELIYSDCVILLGLTYALRYVLFVLSLLLTVQSSPCPLVCLPNHLDSESYYGYLQCL